MGSTASEGAEMERCVHEPQRSEKKEKKKSKRDDDFDGDGGDATTIKHKVKKEKKRKDKQKKEKKHKKERQNISKSVSVDSVVGKSGKKKKKKKRKRSSSGDEEAHAATDDITGKKRKRKEEHLKMENVPLKHDVGETSKKFGFDHKYILAPMVGASELAFRLLCRKYGVQLAYTPMMSSTKFASDAEYRKEEFQTITEDRPLVCHFSANNPKEFAAAAKLVEDKCDAIDLNLGCPQRTAYVGHFGSYLLGPDDRHLILDIVRAGNEAVSIPIFVKIRLLDTLPETIELCQQLRDAGTALIAVHARYRASFERKGPGARDGPALLDQVTEIKRAIPEIPIISNGNVIDYEDVQKNLDLTKSDGIMSAEGILDNPALFLPRLGPNDDCASERQIQIADPSPLPQVSLPAPPTSAFPSKEGQAKKKRKLEKKLRQIKDIEAKVRNGGEGSLNDEQKKKLLTKASIEEEFSLMGRAENAEANVQPNNGATTSSSSKPSTIGITLAQLYESADDKLALANEYIALARRYPVKIRSVVFHVRRMCKQILNQFQLMDDCVSCKTIDEVQVVLEKLARYRADPSTFIFDRDKAAREREALEKKRREEGKRKAYEARMMRKAKREGRADLEYYLRMGAEVPTVELVQQLRNVSKEKQLAAWKKDHSQHCMAYHLDPNGCKRDRTCAFLHVDAKGITTFDEKDEVAG